MCGYRKGHRGSTEKGIIVVRMERIVDQCNKKASRWARMDRIVGGYSKKALRWLSFRMDRIVGGYSKKASRWLRIARIGVGYS